MEASSPSPTPSPQLRAPLSNSLFSRAKPEQGQPSERARSIWLVRSSQQWRLPFKNFIPPRDRGEVRLAHLKGALIALPAGLAVPALASEADQIAGADATAGAEHVVARRRPARPVEGD